MSSERPRRWSRRHLLVVGGAAAVGSLAGCIGNLRSEVTTETDTAAADPLLGGHPAETGLRDQPRLGPPPTEAEGVVVAFEDPSCPRCAAFETETVPKLRERAGDRVSFVLRSYPVVYPWGEPATQAIEATFAREMEIKADATTTEAMDGKTEQTTTSANAPYGFRQGSEATWALVRHYSEEQDRFDAENVLDRTRRFLAEETDLDAEAVVADAEEKAYDDAVQADLSAGQDADVGQTTPTVFLFRDGEFRTSAKGSISFQVLSSALGL